MNKMKSILTKISREKGYNYKVDKEGNVIKESYSWIKDPYTLVALAIIVLSCLYYIQLKEMKTTEANFEDTCMMYQELRTVWMQENPGKIPTLEEVFSIKKDGFNG